jgi:hypothetical protein
MDMVKREEEEEDKGGFPFSWDPLPPLSTPLPSLPIPTSLSLADRHSLKTTHDAAAAGAVMKLM